MVPLFDALEKLHAIIAETRDGIFLEEHIEKLEKAYREPVLSLYSNSGEDWRTFESRVQKAFDLAAEVPSTFARALIGKTRRVALPREVERRQPMPKLKAEAFDAAIRWLADERKQESRGGKATVFLLECFGLHLFPGCTTLADVQVQQRVPPASFYAWRREIRAAGARLGPTIPEEEAD